MGPRSFNQGVVRSVSRACIQYLLAKQTCKKHLGVKQGHLFFSLAEIDIACIACIASLCRENRFTKTANWTSDLTYENGWPFLLGCASQYASKWFITFY